MFCFFQINNEDKKVVNALLTFDYLAKISHLPPRHQRSSVVNGTTGGSLQAFIASLLLLDTQQCSSGEPGVVSTTSSLSTAVATPPPGVTQPRCTSSISGYNLSSKVCPSFPQSASAHNIGNKGAVASSIVRTNSTTLPSSQRDQSSDIRDFRLRAGTLAGRIGGLQNRRFRGYSSLDDSINNGVANSPRGSGAQLTGTPQQAPDTLSGDGARCLLPGITLSGKPVLTNYAQRESGTFSHNSSVSSNNRNSLPTNLSSKSWERPGPEGDQDRVQDVHFTPDVPSLLQYCTQAEILLSTFTQGIPSAFTLFLWLLLFILVNECLLMILTLQEFTYF